MKRIATTVSFAGTASSGEASSWSLLQAARTQANGFRSAVRPALAQATQAAGQDRGSKGSEGSSSSRWSDENGSGG